MSTNAIEQPPQMLGIGTRQYPSNGTVPLAFTGTSDATTDAIGSVEATLVATAPCYVAWGATPEADAADSFYLPAGLPFTLRLATTDKVAALQVSSSGTLYITPASSS